MAQVQEIQVSGLLTFPGNRWRDAFLHYLFGIWADHSDVTYRPKIALGGISVRWNPEDPAKKYYVYGHRPFDRPACPDVPSENKLVVGRTQDVFEGGLIRFVKNDRILLLELQLPLSASLLLWKNPQERGFLGVAFRGELPPAGPY